MAKDTTATDAPFEHADEKTAKAFDLQPHLVGMMLEEPFYTKVMRILTKTRTRAIPTAGVIAKEGDLQMYWNDRFMAALPGKQIRGVLKHECLHLIFEHTTTRKYEPHKVWNYATDLAINSHIRGELPDMCLMPGEKEFADYPVGKSAEWYFAELKKNPPEDGGGGGGEGDPNDGDGQFDDHEGWGDVPSEVKEMAKERLKEVMKKNRQPQLDFILIG